MSDPATLAEGIVQKMLSTFPDLECDTASHHDSTYFSFSPKGRPEDLPSDAQIETLKRLIAETGSSAITYLDALVGLIGFECNDLAGD